MLKIGDAVVLFLNQFSKQGTQHTESNRRDEHLRKGGLHHDRQKQQDRQQDMVTAPVEGDMEKDRSVCFAGTTSEQIDDQTEAQNTEDAHAHLGRIVHRIHGKASQISAPGVQPVEVQGLRKSKTKGDHIAANEAFLLSGIGGDLLNAPDQGQVMEKHIDTGGITGGGLQRQAKDLIEEERSQMPQAMRRRHPALPPLAGAKERQQCVQMRGKVSQPSEPDLSADIFIVEVQK